MATTTTTDPNAVEYDIYGNPKPKKAATQPAADTLSLQDPNSSNATVKLSSAAMSGAAAPTAVTDTTQGNTAVLQKAQNDVLNQPATSTLQDATTATAQKFVQNPMGDFNPAQNKQAQLEKANNDWANTFESMRQQYGNVSGSGLLQKNMLSNALQHNVDQNTLSSQIDTDNYNKYVDSMSKAIAAGQGQTQSNENIFSQRLGNLGTVRGMAEGEATRTAQQQVLDKTYSQDVQKMAIANGYDLTKLDKQYGQETATLIANQDWQGAQASLDRAAAVAKQNNDIQAQKDIQDKQNAFDMEKLNKTQDWQSAQNKIDNDLKLAMQSNDINATSANIQKQLDLDKWKQQNGQEFTAQQNAINNALQVSLKTMDIDSQKELMGIKAKIDQGTLLQTQDFQGAQSALDRAAQQALQSGNIQGQKDIETLRGQITQQAQQAQNAFVDAQRTATEGWQSGERVSTQDYQTGVQYLDQQNKLAIQANDITAQKYLATQKANLDLQMQTQEMDQQTKMAYLNNQLADAKANNDVGRQKDILAFQNTQDLAKIDKEQGFEAAMQSQKDKLALAMQGNDFAQQKAIMESTQQFQSQQAAMDRGIKEMEVQLQAKGIDMQQYQQQWDMLSKSVEAGQLNPSVLNDFIGKIAGGTGITLTPPDPTATYKEAQKQMAGLQAQFGLTHPEYIADETTGTLTYAGNKAFATFYNTNEFGEGGVTEKDLEGKSADDPTVQAAMKTKDLMDPVNLWSASGDAIKGTGQLIKVTDPKTRQPVLVQYVSNSGLNIPTYGNVGVMLFRRTDGTQFNMSTNKDYDKFVLNK